MSHENLPILGMTMVKVTRDSDERLVFETDTGDKYIMMHHQSCSESFSIEDLDGDLNDLVGYPIVQAEVATNEEDMEYGHSTWTFYKISTVRGSVHIRWYGESNGYYSEEVSFYKEN